MKEGRKEGGSNERKECRIEGDKEGLKEGRKEEGRKEFPLVAAGLCVGFYFLNHCYIFPLLSVQNFTVSLLYCFMARRLPQFYAFKVSQFLLLLRLYGFSSCRKNLIKYLLKWLDKTS